MESKVCPRLFFAGEVYHIYKIVFISIFEVELENVTCRTIHTAVVCVCLFRTLFITYQSDRER